MAKQEYKRSMEGYGKYPYVIHTNRGVNGTMGTTESPMIRYNVEVKTENDVFGWGETDVPAKKVFICVNTFAYQNDAPAIQFMCGWKDFAINGFSEEDYYHCMMYLEEGQSVQIDCDYEGVVIMCVAANSHMAYIKQELKKQ